METDAVAVSAYIIFLSQNMSDMPQQELDDLLLVRQIFLKMIFQ